MAVNMNEREPGLVVFLVCCVLLCNVPVAFATTTPVTAPLPTTPTNTTTTTTATTTTATTTTATTTTTTTVATTTTIAPLQPPTVLDSNSLIGQCPCDLTGNACDVNCCCDGDCTADDKLAFSQCLPFSTNVDDRLCVRDDIVQFENSDPVVSEITDDNLFCIYYDNKQERNYYTNPSKVSTVAAFEAYVQEFPTFSFQSAPTTVPTVDSSFYKSGDPVYTVFESQAVGVLGLPRSLTTLDCVDSNPTAYLSDETHSCVRNIASLAADCTAGSPGLDVNTFISGFRVVKSPQLFQDLSSAVPGTNNFYSLYNNSLTVAVALDSSTAVDPVQCFDPASDLTGPCPYPTDPPPSPSQGTNTCDRVVKQVHYRVVTDGTSGIISVLARVVLTDITVPSSGAASFTQSFSASFEASTTTESFERSGNPGYVVGQPVLAGTLNQTTDGTTITDQIFINTNRDRYMTVVRASASGNCFSDSDNRMSVVFGQSVRTGCMLRVSASNLTQYCALMQQKIIHTLEFDSVPEIGSNGFRDTNRYVGLYGNSDVSKSGDWVKILYQNRALPTTLIAGSSNCQLSLGMHIQVLYSNIGALVNPQAKIIAVSFVYDTATVVQIRPTLTGEYNQPLEIVTSVAFIDVSKPAAKFQGEAPIFLAKIPYDFFYPFISGASSPRPLLSAFLPLLIVVLKCCRVL